MRLQMSKDEVRKSSSYYKYRQYFCVVDMKNIRNAFFLTKLHVTVLCGGSVIFPGIHCNCMYIYKFVSIDM
jgi:hypothetical protein